MKTKCMRMDWLVPFVGLAVTAAALVAAKTYLELERKTQAALVFTAVVDRLYHDQDLSLALRAIHEGKVQEAAARLDLVLCDDILLTDAELASADARTRTFAEDAFRRIALARPKLAQMAPGKSAEEWGDDQNAAEQILSRALGAAHTAKAN